MAEAHMLSTKDNPWNPWTDFNAWLAYDMRAGHFTLSYLDRITISSDELSEADQDLAVEQAIEEILRINGDAFYIAVPEPKT
jgi:hypothetical protein